MENVLNKNLENILDIAGKISVEYNNSIIMPEHIISAILSIENFSLTSYLSSKGITNDLISNYIYLNRKGCNYDRLTTHKETIKLMQKAKDLCLEKKSDFIPEFIIMALFELDYEISLVHEFNSRIDNFNTNLICKDINKIVNNSKENIDENIFNYGKILNNEFLSKKLPNIIGRENEINKVVETLLNFTNPHCILLGENGVGKTSIVYGLVKNICERKIHDKLKNKLILQLDLLKILNLFSQNPNNLDNLFEICNLYPHIILFIDNCYGMCNSSISKTNETLNHFLKNLISKTKNSIILTTNTNDYNLYIKNDNFLLNKFPLIEVFPSNFEDTIEIIKSRKEEYFNHYNIDISDECIEKIVTLSDKYIKNEFFPNKAIVLTEACFSKFLNNYGTHSSNKEKLVNLKNELENLKLIHEDSKIESILQQIEIVENNLKKDNTLDFNTIDMVLAEKLKIPTKQIFFDNNEKFNDLEEMLSQNFIGHEKILKDISNCVKRNKQGYNTTNNKPIGSFLFLGPSGIGKSALAKELAKILFNDENNIITLNMSEFCDQNSLSRILGTQSFNNNDSNFLLSKINKMPYCVLILDNIEKAHNSVIDLFTQVLENGFLKDFNDKITYFSNVIIIMTSCCGVDKLKLLPSDRVNEIIQSTQYDEFLSGELEKVLPFDFLNRFDLKLVFKPITSLNDIAKLLTKRLEVIVNKIKIKDNLNLSFTHESCDYLMVQCLMCNCLDGVRPMLRIIESLVLDELMNFILNNDVSSCSTIVYDYCNNKIKIEAF
ncbi:MAG: ATP-dependent Clp protease ATP-binding subunit [Clostridia bacterium]|nr:ATP-dependent Clp protease ATP-binding subunit [Clostridia bacterium]